MINVAVVGIQGVPANYGGFESLVENIIGENCPPDIKYTIFCSSADMKTRMRFYKGATLKYVKLHANGMSSISYDIVSLARSLNGFDVILILGVSGCLTMPMLRRMTSAKIIVNIDGLEHRREKWGRAARWLLRTSEAMAVKYADITVADNKGIQDYVRETYGKEAVLISYGGDHVHRDIPISRTSEILSGYGLEAKKYAVAVCRIEPENNCHVVLDAFSKTSYPLVFVGNWHHSEWAKNLKTKYSSFPNLKLLDAIYDLDVLYSLRSNAALYIHGHSAGGTNPSLVEAMHFGMPILAYNVVYNRETTENRAYYFTSAEDLRSLLTLDGLDGSPMLEIARRRYTWKNIAKQYTSLFRSPATQ